MERKRLRKLVLGGLSAAVITIMTALVKLPVPASGGYVHPGDGAIFLAAALLGPYAAIPAALGSALADILGGYMIYALPTAAIKGMMGWLAGKLARGDAPVQSAWVFALCECVMAGGYFLFEWAAFGIGAAFGALGPNLLQGAAGVIFGCALSQAAVRMKRRI